MTFSHSNASDALDKLRFLSVTDSGLLKDAVEFDIRIQLFGERYFFECGLLEPPELLSCNCSQTPSHAVLQLR